jgi:hypothetical protein
MYVNDNINNKLSKLSISDIDDITDKLSKLSISIFKNFYNEIIILRKRKKTITKDIGQITYDLGDLFNFVIEYCKDNTTLRKSLDTASHFNDTYLSTTQYWLTKIYTNKSLYDTYHLIYNYASSLNFLIFLDPTNPIYVLHKKYNIYVGDGTVCECNFKNSGGKSIASYTISSVLHIASNLIYDFNIQYDNNELTGITKTKFTKNDIIILDRGYSKLLIIDYFLTKTNFVVRLTKNLLIYKTFIKNNESESIIMRGEHKLKLIKYHIDKNLQAIIQMKYNEDDNATDDDNDSVFVIATNLISLTYDDLINLYKERWNIEVCNKYIKSNFNLRHIVKQCKSSNPIDKIGFFTSLSFLLYNITMLEKKLIEKKYSISNNKNINLNYSNIVTNYKKFLIDTINPPKNIIMTKEIKDYRSLLNKQNRNKKNIKVRKKKKGKYICLDKMAKKNNRNDILEQIIKYYKLIKQIKIKRKYVPVGD